MSSGTKQAIIASFLHLVGKKPPDKITVRDIVDDCGVNRNTFYYYFQDIYAVLEEMCNEVMEALPKDAALGKTMAAFYAHILHFTNARPAAARSLALSLGYEGLERYYGASLSALITDCHVRAYGTPPSPVHVRLLRHAILGLCLDAMRGGKDPAIAPCELEQLPLLPPTAEPPSEK